MKRQKLTKVMSWNYKEKEYNLNAIIIPTTYNFLAIIKLITFDRTTKNANI